MKKYLMLLTCCVAIGIAMNVSLQFRIDSDKSEITLGNIEALAQGESGSGNCWFRASVDCPYSSIKVLYVE
ncbi:hypothetical protein H8B06_08510 [Sphingobacterium sp. DN00404]|uniref:NVEALA protein n=1 Tax=Sphingobacterium micropteri TaxID=2763501 RepID=A0ABR7YNE8_9SPHI|nr:hypothetical protein [Sphingobacterium micropteri]